MSRIWAVTADNGYAMGTYEGENAGAGILAALEERGYDGRGAWEADGGEGHWFTAVEVPTHRHASPTGAWWTDAQAFARYRSAPRGWDGPNEGAHAILGAPVAERATFMQREDWHDAAAEFEDFTGLEAVMDGWTLTDTTDSWAAYQTPRGIVKVDRNLDATTVSA